MELWYAVNTAGIGRNREEAHALALRDAWKALDHAHCHCGSRLVDQLYEGTRPLCIDCGYFDEECRCADAPCDYCG